MPVLATTRDERTMVDLVLCRACGQFKHESEFHSVTTGSRTGGQRQGLCKPCSAAYYRALRLRHRSGEFVDRQERDSCRDCGKHMWAARRRGWLCRSCDLGKKQAGRAERAARSGKTFVPGVKPWIGRRIAASRRGPGEGVWRRLEEQNAREAWVWWVAHAPAWWLEARDRELYGAKPWKRPGLSGAEKFRLRYRLDPDYHLLQRLRIQARKKRFGRIGEDLRTALKRGHPGKRISAFLGYSIADLRLHLERQFTKRMTWEWFCSGDIHIEHILPLSMFDLTDPDEARRAWALANLRPMWGSDNIAKGGRRELLL